MVVIVASSFNGVALIIDCSSRSTPPLVLVVLAWYALFLLLLRLLTRVMMMMMRYFLALSSSRACDCLRSLVRLGLVCCLRLRWGRLCLCDSLGCLGYRRRLLLAVYESELVSLQ